MIDQDRLTADMHALVASIPATLAGYRALWAAFRSAMVSQPGIRLHVGCDPPWRLYSPQQQNTNNEPPT